MAIKEASDNMDAGLKQWIIMGVSIAVSFIPVAGPLISCIVDGTFVDMLTAISKGDWAMLGMCCLAFIPGGKALKGLKAVGKFSGKGQKFIRYMGKTEYKQVMKTGRIQSQSGTTYMTKTLYKDKDTMIKKLAKRDAGDKYYVEFEIRSNVQVNGPRVVAPDLGAGLPGGGIEYWVEGDALEVSILRDGILP